jgi:hypothetical protein
VKEAQIKPRKAKEELRPFYTIFGTDQRAIEAQVTLSLYLIQLGLSQY